MNAANDNSPLDGWSLEMNGDVSKPVSADTFKRLCDQACGHAEKDVLGRPLTEAERHLIATKVAAATGWQEAGKVH